MSTATATATDAKKEWVSPHEAARLLGIKRDTMLKYASIWGIRVRAFPRLNHQHRFRIVNLADLLRFRSELEAEERAALGATAGTAAMSTRRTARQATR